MDEVDVAAFVNGANIADANQWTLGGVVLSTDDKFAVLSELLNAGGGLAVARGAQISCIALSPKTSVTSITADDIVGEVELVNTTPYTTNRRPA